MRRLIPYGILTAIAVVMAWPFLWMLATSLKSLLDATTPDLIPWPRGWHWENYPATFRAAPFARYFLNSFLVAGSVSLSVVLTSLMAGYAFARLRFPFKSVLFLFCITAMMVPFEVIFIPNFVLITRLGWYNSYSALIVPWCANAFSVFLMRQAFLALPADFFDAARMDGCGHFRFLFRVGAPLVRPALITVGIFAFLGSYNALLWPLVVTADVSMRVVQVGLTVFASDTGVRMNLLMCAAAIVITPTILLYFAAQRYFTESAWSGGIKS